MSDRPSKRRRAHRMPLAPPLPSRLNGRLEARVLDLSLLGVQIEHRGLVRPGQAYTLNVDLPGERPPVHMVARAAWSLVHRLEGAEDGAIVVYRTGLEFLELPAGVRLHLTGLLAELARCEMDHDRAAAEAARAS